jgi:hypothetical protein
MTEVRLHKVRPFLSFMLAAACLATTDVRAEGAAGGPGWAIEQGTDQPSYAAVEPLVTNLNIDTVVLACEEASGKRILQLQLYLTDDGPMRPKYPTLQPFKRDPRAAVSIDRLTFPAAVLFADDYAVLADAQEGAFPLLSDALLEAMQTGSRMTLHLDLLEERPGQPAAFDGEAVIDLEAPGGRQAVAAMRRCASPAAELLAATSVVRP